MAKVLNQIDKRTRLRVQRNEENRNTSIRASPTKLRRNKNKSTVRIRQIDHTVAPVVVDHTDIIHAYTVMFWTYIQYRSSLHSLFFSLFIYL